MATPLRVPVDVDTITVTQTAASAFSAAHGEDDLREAAAGVRDTLDEILDDGTHASNGRGYHLLRHRLGFELTIAPDWDAVVGYHTRRHASLPELLDGDSVAVDFDEERAWIVPGAVAAFQAAAGPGQGVAAMRQQVAEMLRSGTARRQRDGHFRVTWGKQVVVISRDGGAVLMYRREPDRQRLTA